ncbi:hypothetical protein [Bradyrhizobium sp. Ash2021]|uniref:hypothetical protein n=1 Tax=Bradyrhizobium sp. Ash2021 TaxID=2954771 RepID=UPI0028154FC9|nr:hypothetical protein [Bradyrhizobium sp. Ash2021]WMT79509.1 hypothetical protein NL528_46530 [Bradyrhizobium sp. Ash2021]
MAKLREQAETCRRLAGPAGDEEIERRLKALADEYEARAVDSEARDPSNKK